MEESFSMTNENSAKRYLDGAAAAEYLGLSLSKVRRMTALEELPHAKVGRRCIYDTKDLDAWIEERKRGFGFLRPKGELRPA